MRARGLSRGREVTWYSTPALRLGRELMTPESLVKPRLGAEPIDPGAPAACQVSIVMPCLNEADTLAACIAKAQEALRELGCAGEVVVADNGSTDGSQEIASRLGARVVPVAARGYGNALREGIAA